MSAAENVKPATIREFANAMAALHVAAARHKLGEPGATVALIADARVAANAVFDRMPKVEQYRAAVLPMWGLIPVYASFEWLEKFRKYQSVNVDVVR